MNIVFDLGGVVFTWSPQDLVADVFENKFDQKKILEEIIGKEEWVELDRGTIKPTDAIKSITNRTSLPLPKIKELINKASTYLQPLPETVELIERLKKKGNKLFVLSNMHHASIEYIEKNNSFWDLFDGLVISCRINMVKPEPQIYKYLLEKFDLPPYNTVFIDDTEINLTTANQFGINTIKYSNTAQCEFELKKLDCM